MRSWCPPAPVPGTYTPEAMHSSSRSTPLSTIWLLEVPYGYMKLGVVSVTPRAEISRKEKQKKKQNQGAFKFSFSCSNKEGSDRASDARRFFGEAGKFLAKPGTQTSPQNIPGN